ncbi:hypothetical protein BSLG_009760 [Batrachochytrium salamandrivorans]|nr:hypothetical protein BSLG_009760 [Batrachochytrium salamandrivorans]
MYRSYGHHNSPSTAVSRQILPTSQSVGAMMSNTTSAASGGLGFCCQTRPDPIHIQDNIAITTEYMPTTVATANTTVHSQILTNSAARNTAISNYSPSYTLPPNLSISAALETPAIHTDYLLALASLCTCFMRHVWPSPSLIKPPARIASCPSYPQAPLSPPAEQCYSSPAYEPSPFPSPTSLIAITRTPAETVLVSLKYLFMLRQRYPGDIENAGGSEYRLFVTALILAHKMQDDSVCSMNAWSKITSIPVAELLQMEFEFLSVLDYRLHVSPDDYQTWCTQLGRFLAIARKNEAQQQVYQKMRVVRPPSPMDISAHAYNSA